MNFGLRFTDGVFSTMTKKFYIDKDGKTTDRFFRCKTT